MDGSDNIETRTASGDEAKRKGHKKCWTPLIHIPLIDFAGASKTGDYCRSRGIRITKRLSALCFATIVLNRHQHGVQLKP